MYFLRMYFLLAVHEDEVFFLQLVIFHVTHFGFLRHGQREGLGGTARALGSYEPHRIRFIPYCRAHKGDVITAEGGFLSVRA